ncbi:sodium:solute symporter [Bacteroidota bacterium]
MNEPIFIIIVAGSLIINLVIAVLNYRKVDFKVFSSDPNKHGFFVMAISIAGTIVGGGMFMAVGQIGYEAGTAGYVIGIVYILGLGLVGTFADRIRNFMDEHKHNSLIEVLDFLFDSKVVIHFCVINLSMYVFLLASQFVALYQFAEYIQNLVSNSEIPWILVGLAVLIIFLYPLIGGLRKDIITDVFQVTLVFGVAVYIIIKIYNLNSISVMFQQMPVEHLTGMGYGIVFILGAILFLTPSFLVRMDIWQRIRATKNNRDTKKAFWIAGIISAFFYIFFTTIGMLAFHNKFPEPKYATLNFIMSIITDPISLGLILGAFFAAVLSSADTFINVSSIFITRLFSPQLWEKTKKNSGKDKKLLKQSRYFGAIIIVFAILLASATPNFVDLLVGAFSLLLIYLPTILSLFVVSWRSSLASFWSSSVGLVVFVILFFTWDPKIAFAPAVILASAVFTVLLIIEKRKK